MKKLFQVIAGAALIALVALTARPCLAADSAVLRNGFSIRHERRQVLGTITRLFVGGDNSSFVDIPTIEIDHFETAPDEPHLPLQSSTLQASALQASALQASDQSLVHPPGLNKVDLNELVKTASGNSRLDPDLVTSVIRAESGFNVRAVSPKGAQGLMQLMPQTSSQLGVQNAFDPQANVEGGTRYLRELLERYNFDLIKALAAYNAGPQRVEQYGGVPPYYETKAYVARIVRDFNRKKLAANNAAQPGVSKKAVPKKAANKSTATHQAPAKVHESPEKSAKAAPTPTTESN
jgi:soluble lytic murein transglycosylase-like protein